jgi:hypothetical protein
VQQCRGHRQRRQVEITGAARSRSPAVPKNPAAPTPIRISPMFSVVELPSSRLRFVPIAACRMP